MKVRYHNKVLDVCQSTNPGFVVLYEGLPENPDPYDEISDEVLATLERVHDEFCELPSSHLGTCQYYGDIPIKK